MKTLLLLRHGQASPHSPGGDKGRELTDRGEWDVADIGRRVRDTFGCPDLIVSSDAARAHRTALVVAHIVGYTGDVLMLRQIYEADCGDLLQLVAALPEAADRVLLVGHNPGLGQLAAALDAEGAWPPALPTAGLIPLSLDRPRWQDVRARTGRADALITPNDPHQPDKGT